MIIFGMRTTTLIVLIRTTRKQSAGTHSEVFKRALERLALFTAKGGRFERANDTVTSGSATTSLDFARVSPHQNQQLLWRAGKATYPPGDALAAQSSLG